MGSKSDVSAFFRLRFRNGLGTKPAGALPFRMRSRRSLLRLCLVAEVSLCLVAEVSQWLGHDSIVFRGSKSNVSRFLRLQFRNGLDVKPAGSFFFLMGSKSDVSAFFRLRFRNGLFAWLGHYFFVFSLFFCLFLVGSKSDVSAFFRLRFRNGLGTKPAGALPFRMRSRRSFLRLCLVAEVSLCLVAEVSQWLGHALFLVGSKNNVSALFLAAVSYGVGTILLSFLGTILLSFSWVPKATFRFRNGSGTKPAGVLLFRTRVPNTFFLSLAWWLAGFFFVFSRFQKQRFGSFLAAVSHGLGTLSFFLMGSKSDVSAFFRLRFRNGLFAWLGHYFFVFSLFFVCF